MLMEDAPDVVAGRLPGRGSPSVVLVNADVPGVRAGMGFSCAPGGICIA